MAKQDMIVEAECRLGMSLPTPWSALSPVIYRVELSKSDISVRY
jgi:hypothetical protein